MKVRQFFPFALLVIFSTGCAAPKMYHWGTYSETLYASKKTSTEENLLKHKQNLEAIIEESQKRDLRVPPGVYAELGYIYFRQSKNDEAIKYFQLEEKLYPESQILMQRLTQAAKAREETKENKKEPLETSSSDRN